MNHSKFLTILALTLWMAWPQMSEAQANLNRLKRRAEQAATQRGQQTAPTANVPTAPNDGAMAADSSEEEIQALVDPSQPNDPVGPASPLAFDTPLPTRVTYESLLKSTRLDPKTGELTLRQDFTLAFLPPRQEDGQPARYGIEPEAHKVTIALVRGGDELVRYCTRVMQTDGGEFRSKRKGPFVDVSIDTYNYTLEERGFSRKPYRFSQPGEYQLLFRVDDRLVQRFPFEVRVEKSDDPYTTSSGLYQLEGPWQAYSYLEVQPGQPNGYVNWTFFHRHQQPEQRQVTYLMEAMLFRNGTFLASTGMKTVSAQHQWNPLQLSFSIPGDASANTTDLTTGRLLEVRDVTQAGEYEIRVSYYDPKSYDREGRRQPIANPEGRREDRYRFTVKGGTIQPQGLQDRTQNEGTHLIEGGRDQFWLKRL